MSVARGHGIAADGAGGGRGGEGVVEVAVEAIQRHTPGLGLGAREGEQSGVISDAGGTGVSRPRGASALAQPGVSGLGGRARPGSRLERTNHPPL